MAAFNVGALQGASFHGAKLWLTHRGQMLTLLRDDRPGLPFPGHWDLPGGGREGGESPVDCALRELSEEFGLHLPPDRLTGHAFVSHAAPPMRSWLFTGALHATEIASIRFGSEGQGWRMMPVDDYLAHPRAVPHFCRWITQVRAASPQTPEPADADCRP
ncbi:NUDIX hydrolase [Paracoccus nototheniae]|uniref:NUDIX hydrolase n=1 Tax=Paracoccus nototheniae TaxID=2489002 RepID=A0ABW4DRS7_9RHOB|nr:NUDIX hydrolase [Paracoccus nototheniae]